MEIMGASEERGVFSWMSRVSSSQQRQIKTLALHIHTALKTRDQKNFKSFSLISVVCDRFGTTMAEVKS